MGNASFGRHSKLVAGFVAFMMTLPSNPLAAETGVPNPDVPCWLGQGEAGAENDQDVFWDTQREETKPYLITHDRELMHDGGVPTQADYNYLVYWFGNPHTPIQARHYLDWDKVSLILPKSSNGPWTLEQAKEALPDSVVCYLQKRFSKIDVLTKNGYEELWALGKDR